MAVWSSGIQPTRSAMPSRGCCNTARWARPSCGDSRFIRGTRIPTRRSNRSRSGLELEGRSKSLADNATYYYGTGRRKNAIARVRLYPGEGTILVNNKPSLQYFGRRMLEMVVVEPLKLTESQKRFNVSAMVNGGGMSGQAGAVQHGIARALCAADLAMRPVLKKHGMLTRDPRMKERKKPGLKRARKAPQYTKR